MILPFALNLPGGQEMVIILLVVLVIFGAKRLPEIGRSLGEGIQEFKKSSRKAIEDDEAKPAKTSDSKD